MPTRYSRLLGGVLAGAALFVLLSLPLRSPSSPRGGFDAPTAAPTAALGGAGGAGQRSLPAAPLQPLRRGGSLTQVWANEGGDKVWQSELRAANAPGEQHNSAWDGSRVTLFGARNEVVSFNLVLEAPSAAAAQVRVEMGSLRGPGGAQIDSQPASGDAVFNFVGRNVELFYVRYLEIKGLSSDLAFDHYDERHIPGRCRRPYDDDGIGSGTWQDRPCHNQLFPEIAVPLELQTPFSIPAGANQSIWGDIYIPKTVPAGVYTAVITISEGGAAAWAVPLSLRVHDFSLPDLPAARTMLFFSQENVNDRYLGVEYPDPGTPAYAQAQLLADRHFQLAHRHKISLIDGYISPGEMDQAWAARLDGSLFSAAHGYAGVGVSTGNNVYSIGTYGGWPWQGAGQAEMWSSSDAWVNWFDAHPFATPTDYFLYLIDESDNFAQTEQWAQWMDANPGPGSRLMSMATIDLPDATAYAPSLDVVVSSLGVGVPQAWQPAADAILANPGKRFYQYNGSRPASGSFAIEDEGAALREKAWAQYKKGIQRWFYWESTYYNNFQGNTGQTNVFQKAQTFGGCCSQDAVLGETGYNYTNGDGVLFYPGSDTRYPGDSYGVMGPLASLRLKDWRRGIQDVDYLALANAIDPVRTQSIVQRMVPKALWEYGVSDPADPTWVRGDISWPVDPDSWEAARAELAGIIEGAGSYKVYVPFCRLSLAPGRRR